MNLDKETKGQDKNSNDDNGNKNTWVYLTTADNEFEYNIIKGKLAQNSIVCVGKGQDMDLLDSGFLSIILGPCIAVDIMVPYDLFDQAKQVMDFKISDEELEEQAMSSKQEENNGES